MTDSWQPPSAGLLPCFHSKSSGEGWEVWRRCRYVAIVCMQLYRVLCYTWDWNLFRWHWHYRINIDSREKCPTYIFPFDNQQKCTDILWAPSRRQSENFVIFVCLFLFFTSSLNSTIKHLFPVSPFPLPKPTALLSFCPSFPCQRIFVFRTFKTGSTGKLSCHFVCKPATASMGTGQAPCQWLQPLSQRIFLL